MGILLETKIGLILGMKIIDIWSAEGAGAQFWVFKKSLSECRT
jgi:hypothetical protein